MESKKRKLVRGEVFVDQLVAGNGELSTFQSEKNMRSLLDSLRKEHLVDILLKLGLQIPEVAEEIISVANTDPVHRKLFVRGLALETTSETLCAAFRVHGEIEEGVVIADKTTGKSRCYGFVTYKGLESTYNALEEPSKLIDGRLAVCNLACEGLSSASVSADVALRKLYIGGLSPDISSETLLNFFAEHGEIEEGSVAYEKETNKSRGFGFVTYKTIEAAKKAIDDPNKMLGARNITVKIADTQRKSKVMQQPQIPTAVVPIAIPIPAGYPHAGKSPTCTAAPLTYAPYPYPSPYSISAPHYSLQAQVPYPHVARKKEPYGLPSASPTGVSGYPYYLTKH